MFGNLKNKLGDVADLKKYSAPQLLNSLTGSRQRSSQHTPGVQTPNLSHHSRQSSISSLQNVGLVAESSPSSIIEEDENVSPNHKPVRLKISNQELENELLKLRNTLETQQDASLKRISAKEEEFKYKMEQELRKISILENQLKEAKEKEINLKAKLEKKDHEVLERNAALIIKEEKLKEIESKLVTLQENYDQLEGFGSQESSKVKHLLLSSSSELESVNAELNEKSIQINELTKQLQLMSNLDEKLNYLSAEKMEMDTSIAGLNQKLKASNLQLQKEREEHQELVQHLQEKILTLSQRSSQDTLQESEKNLALIKERNSLEHRLEESREQLNNIKSSWSNKISALESQIHNLNMKIAEDQVDIKAADQVILKQKQEILVLEQENEQTAEEMKTKRQEFEQKISMLEENIEASKGQLETSVCTKDKEIKELRRTLHIEEETTNQLKEAIDAKDDECCEMRTKVSEFDTELQTMKESYSMLQDKNTFLQTSYSAMQESLNHERKLNETLQKDYNSIQSKFEVVCTEKTKLSSNLDSYLDKVNKSEEQLKLLQEDNKLKDENISYLERQLNDAVTLCSKLELSLSEFEMDFEKKVEESEIVAVLKGQHKAFEDEIEEKRNMIKVQSQRLADMKKTLQRELKRNVDGLDVANDSGGSTTVSPRSSVNEPAKLHIGVGSTHLPNYSNFTVMHHNGTDDELVNLEYLKHVILKFVTSREYEAIHLTRAVATLLRMTPEEEKYLKESLEFKMSWFGSRPNYGRGQFSKAIPPSP